MPKGTFLVMIAMAAATGCGFSAAPANTTTPPSTSPPSTFPSTTSTTVPSSTSTTSVYESLGEEVAVSESVLGAMAWRRASSIPAELVLNGGLPGPTHMWTYDWLARYENAREVTGACFEIYEVGAGYLGLGPCPDYWAPEAAWDALRPEWQQNRQWDSAEWIWMREVWSSPDGESWDQTTMSFPDATAAVVALPWVVAEKDGRWVVIGVTGVGEDADIPWDDRTNEQKWGSPGLIVTKTARPGAWMSDDLSEWDPVAANFSKEGFDTALTSVIAGEPGWVIFGVHASREPPRVAEWVAWASTDGITWEELSMAGVYDTPCKPTRYWHCGMIKAHFVHDAIVAYAWTWPLKDEYGVSPHPGWRLLIGEF